MKLISAFVFAYVKCWFSHDTAQVCYGFMTVEALEGKGSRVVKEYFMTSKNLRQFSVEMYVPGNCQGNLNGFPQHTCRYIRRIRERNVYYRTAFSVLLPDASTIKDLCVPYGDLFWPYEPPHGKTNNLHMRKQRRRSASRLPRS